MSVFAWSEKYSVNVREIDDQHKKLVRLVSQLHTAMSREKEKRPWIIS